jgi:hypothetical protein
MAKYDSSKDKLLREIGCQKKLRSEGKGFLAARVYSYDEGEPKLAVERLQINREGEERHVRPLGRVSRQEAAWINKAIDRWLARTETVEPALKTTPKRSVKKVTDKKAKTTSEPHVVSEPRKPGVKPAKARRKKRPVKKVK